MTTYEQIKRLMLDTDINSLPNTNIAKENDYMMNAIRDATMNSFLNIQGLIREQDRQLKVMREALEIAKALTKRYLQLTQANIDGSRIAELREINYQADAALAGTLDKEMV